jgi:hypothetical protein
MHSERHMHVNRPLLTNSIDSIGRLTIYDNADVVSPRLVASRAAVGASTVIADAATWNALKEQQS